MGVGDGTAGNHPVQQVSWYDVVKWCNARSEKEGLSPVYHIGSSVYKTGVNVPTINASANGYRLPSQKEWELAARGGVSSQGYTYSGSNDANVKGVSPAFHRFFEKKAVQKDRPHTFVYFAQYLLFPDRKWIKF